MAVLYVPHFIQFFDDNGDPLAAGKLYTYAAGTTTPKATYTTAAGTISNANPVILDSAGRAVVFLDGSYKFRLETAASVLVREVDNVSAFTTSAVTIDSILPTQTGNAGKFLTTNGSAASWGAGSSGLVPIATTTVSSPVTSVDFVHGTGGVVFDGTYKLYVIEVINLIPSTDSTQTYIRTTTNSGVSYDSTGGDYVFAGSYQTGTTTITGQYDGSSTEIRALQGFSAGSSTGEAVSLMIKIYNPANTAQYKLIQTLSVVAASSSAAASTSNLNGYRTTLSAVNGIRIFQASGNIASGTFKLYGMA